MSDMNQTAIIAAAHDVRVAAKKSQFAHGNLSLSAQWETGKKYREAVEILLQTVEQADSEANALDETVEQTAPTLIQRPSDVNVGDLVVVPGTSIRYPVVSITHDSTYSSLVKYDVCGIIKSAVITEDAMIQITPA